MTTKKFPSQIKYEKENPLISFRVKIPEYEKIRQMTQKSGKNISELVRMALLGLEKDFSTATQNAKTTGEQEGKTSGHDTSYSEGYRQGTKDWAISLDCWVCKQTIWVKPNSFEHEQIKEKLRNNISHEKCYPLRTTS